MCGTDPPRQGLWVRAPTPKLPLNEPNTVDFPIRAPIADADSTPREQGPSPQTMNTFREVQNIHIMLVRT